MCCFFVAVYFSKENICIKLYVEKKMHVISSLIQNRLVISNWPVSFYLASLEIVNALQVCLVTSVMSSQNPGNKAYEVLHCCSKIYRKSISFTTKQYLIKNTERKDPR